MRKSGTLRALCLVLVICVTMVVAFTGCGTSTQSQTQSGTTEANQAAAATTAASTNTVEKVTIRIMTRWTGSDGITSLLKDQFDKFMKENPNIIVQDDSIGEESAYNNKLKTDIATGSPANIFQYPGVAAISGWAQNNVIMNIDPLLDDKAWSDGFIDGSFEIWNMEKYGVKGHFGVPNEFNPEVMFYNTELFAKAGIDTVPETMDDLYAAIDKLKAVGITPWGAGAKDNWRTGHIHNNLIYRVIGVDGAKDLGTRKAKWTDAGVVQSLALLKDLKTRGTFEKGMEGIDYNTEGTMFRNGKVAMVCDGAWAIQSYEDSPVKGKIKFFPFPYLKDKPEYNSDSIMFTGGLFLSGAAKGAEQEAQIKLIKYFTGKEAMQARVDKGLRLSVRKDTIAPADSNQLTKDMITYMATIKHPGGDIFDYDPDPAMIDISRNAIIGMLLKNSPEDAAKQVQDEIDKFEKSK